MNIPTTLILFAVGFFCILVGFPSAVFPKVIIACKRRLYRKMRLISVAKLNKPIKRRKAILTSLDGWASVIVGTVLLWNAPIQFSLCTNGAGHFDQVQSALLGNGTSSTCAELKIEIDRVIQPLIDADKNVGISVGVIRGEDKAVFGYGRVNFDSDRRPDGDTIYEIGSITKVFTALLLADMAQNRIVNPTDPVGEFLPCSVQMPKYDDTEITLIDLVSHLSGLPRLPSGLNKFSDYLSLAFVKNPYASYTPQRLYLFLSKHKLQNKPGAEYRYSNLGMGLLGHALARKQTSTFEDLVVSRICEPLNMKDTRITLLPEQKSRLAQGYDGVFTIFSLCLSFPATNWDIPPPLSGAGALRSTVNDLLKFLAANMGLRRTLLTPAMETTQVARHKISPTMSIAMGWHIQRFNGDDTIIWHNGGTGGYRSYMGFSKNHRVAVVILSNSTSSVDEAGIRILKAFCQIR